MGKEGYEDEEVDGRDEEGWGVIVPRDDGVSELSMAEWREVSQKKKEYIKKWAKTHKTRRLKKKKRGQPQKK